MGAGTRQRLLLTRAHVPLQIVSKTEACESDDEVDKTNVWIRV